MVRTGVRHGAAMVFVAGLFAGVWAITVTVNTGSRFQTIEGLGAMNSPGGWTVKQGAFWVPVSADAVRYFDTLVVDGGYSMLRSDPVSAFQPTQGDFSLNASVRGELSATKKYVDAARRAGQVFRVQWTAWSPPPWMKANNSCCQVSDNDNLNYLLPAHYTSYATHWIRLMQLARDTFGFEPYAISLQNEPLFNEPYVSCNYGIGPGCAWNGVCYNNMFKVVAPLIRAAFPNVKFIASEDLNRTTIETNLRADPISNPLIHAWATHNDFVGSFAYPTDRPIWNTEPHASTFTQAAQMIMANLGAGAAEYTLWERVDNCTTTPTSDATCVKAGTYRAMKMYSRYIRPGALRVQSSGGVNGSSGVIAFYHPVDTCLTIVLVNGTGATEPATLNISGYVPTQFTAIVSSESQDEVAGGVVAPGATYQMPPNSVTTLVAGKYLSTSVRDPQMYPRQARSSSLELRNQPRQVFALDGRVVARVRPDANQPRLARGVYCVSSEIASGNRSVVVESR